jgi:molybdate transport system regulatory protein
MQPKFNLWLENESGEVSISTWRVALLKAVAETGSISGAAAVMKVQYRTAWQKINEMETRLGQKLVETQVGGSHGGGARLTSQAEDYVWKFDRLNAEIEKTVLAKYREMFGK